MPSMLIAAVLLLAIYAIYYLKTEETPIQQVTAQPDIESYNALSKKLEDTLTELSIKSNNLPDNTLQASIDEVKKDLYTNLDILKTNTADAQQAETDRINNLVMSLSNLDSTSKDIKTALDNYKISSDGKVNELVASIKTINDKIAFINSSNASVNQDSIDYVNSKIDSINSSIDGTRLSITNLGSKIADIESKVATSDSVNKSISDIQSSIKTVEQNSLSYTSQLGTAITNLSDSTKKATDELSNSIKINEARINGVESNTSLGYQTMKDKLETTISEINSELTKTNDLIKSIDIAGVKKSLEDYIFSNNADLEKTKNTLQAYINNQFNINADVKKNIETITNILGDVRLYNGNTIQSLISETSKLVTKLDTNSTAMSDKLDVLSKTSETIGDVLKLRDNYISFSASFKLLDSANDIIKNSTIRPSADPVQAKAIYSKYLSDRSSLEKSKVLSTDVITLCDNLMLYVQSLDLTQSSLSQSTQIINSARSSAVENGNLKLITDYIGNLQTAIGNITANNNISNESMMSLKTDVSALIGIVGDMSSFGKNTISSSLKSIYTSLDSIKSSTDVNKTAIDSINVSLNKVIADVSAMSTHAGMIQNLQSDVALLMTRTGTGNILAPNLSKAVEMIWADLNDDKNKIGTVSISVDSILKILGQNLNQSALESMGGDVVTAVSNMKKNLEYFATNIGDFRSDDFNQLPLGKLLSDFKKRIENLESYSSSDNLNKLTNALQEITSIKTFIGGSDFLPYTSKNVVSRLNDLEASIINVISAQTLTTENIKKANDLSTNIASAFNQVLPIINDLKVKVPELTPKVDSLLSDVNSNTINISSTITQLVDIKKSFELQTQQRMTESATLADLVSKFSDQKTVVDSLLSRSSDAEKTINSIVSTSNKLSQVNFAIKLKDALTNILTQYPNVESIITSLVSGWPDVVLSMKTTVSLLDSFTEWSSNETLAKSLLDTQDKIASVYGPIWAYISSGKKIEPINQGPLTMNMYYMWKYLGGPFEQYNDVMTSWVKMNPVWLNLAKSATKVSRIDDSLQNALTSLNNANKSIDSLLTKYNVSSTDIVSIKTALDNIGSWTPTVMDTTLVSAVNRLLSNATVSRSDIDTLTASFKSMNDTVVFLGNEYVKNQDNIKALESLKSVVSSLVNTVNSNNDTAISGIANLNKVINDYNIPDIKNSINKLTDSMIPTVSTSLIADFSFIAGTVKNEFLYSVAPVYKNMVSDFSKLASSINSTDLLNWNYRFSNTDLTKILVSLRNKFTSETKTALLNYNTDYITSLASRVDTNLAFIVGSSANESVQSKLISISDTLNTLSSKISSTDGKSDQLFSILTSIKNDANVIKTAFARMTPADYTFSMQQLNANITTMNTEIDKYIQGYTSATMINAIIVVYDDIRMRPIVNGVTSGFYSDIQPYITDFISKSADMINNSSLYNQFLLTKYVGKYTGTTDISKDIATALSSISDINTNISAITTSTSNNTSRITTAEADIKNLASKVDAAASSSASAIKSSAYTVTAETRTKVYATCYIKNGDILTEDYMSTYAAYKVKTTANGITMAKLLDLCALSPDNVTSKYVSISVESVTMPKNTTYGSMEGYLYSIATYGNYAPSWNNIAFSSDTVFKINNFTDFNMSSKQSDLNGTNIIRLYNSAIYNSIKEKNGKLIALEFNVTITNTPFKTDTAIPEYSGLWTVNAMKTYLSKTKKPVLEANGPVDVSKHGIIMPTYAPNFPYSYTIVNGIYNYTCPSGSYMCGVKLNSNNVLNAVDCCAFGPTA